MRGCQKLGLATGVALLLAATAGMADDIPKNPLAPAQPATGASLQIYIKVKNQQVTEFCKTEQMGVPRCMPGTMYEAKDACGATYKVAAVSCDLADYSFEPKLIENSSDAKQETGSCLWSFTKLPADKAPQATTTLLCVK